MKDPKLEAFLREKLAEARKQFAAQGGRASAKRLTAEQRKARARKASRARWSSKKGGEK